MKLSDVKSTGDSIFIPALEQNMMGAVLINDNDEVLFFNSAAEKLWGYRREEVIGQGISMLIPHDLRAAHPDFIRHNREGGQPRVEGMSRELLLERKDGTKVWTRFALSKVNVEGKIFYLAFVRDASVERHCCKVSDEAAFCLIQRPYISKTLLTRRISPRGSP
ncbi:oxygen sensor protein DosP [Escherichia coli KTE64]|nr:oxygen sensor protein DosP [Escherichia coli KTE64]